MAKEHEYEDCFTVSGRLNVIAWALRNAHETLVAGSLGLQQHGAAYTILAMCEKLEEQVDILEEIGGRADG